MNIKNVPGFDVVKKITPMTQQPLQQSMAQLLDLLIKYPQSSLIKTKVKRNLLSFAFTFEKKFFDAIFGTVNNYTIRMWKMVKTI